MRAGHNVRDDFSVLRIRDTGLKHAHDGGATRIDERIKPHGFADYCGIALKRSGPKTVGQNDGACRLFAVIVLIEQASQNGTQAHDIKIGSANDSGVNLARFSESNHTEADNGKVAERTQRLYSRT